MKQVFKILIAWLPQAFAITMLSGLIFIVGQQVNRQSANDPQIETAEAVKAGVEAGSDPTGLDSLEKIEMSKELGLFMTIFDKDQKIISSSGELDGQNKDLPQGVLEAVSKTGQSRITWQPRPGVRIAAVIMKIDSPNAAFVLVGRSLRETEIRIKNLGIIVLLGWALTLVGSLIVLFFGKWIQTRNP